MTASLIHFVLIHHGGAAQPDRPRVLHFGVEGAEGDRSPTTSIMQLLVLDARRMNPFCLKAAFVEIKRLRTSPGFKHGVLVCDMPQLHLVQSAMRAGLRDIIHEALTARQLVKLLRSATPDQTCARQIAALAAIVRTIAAADQPASAPAATLARREYALVQRAEHLAHQETRLALERAALEDREQKLRVGTRRLERELTALQKEDVIRAAPAHTATPFSTSPFATDLQAIATQLAERAHTLDIRERMLKEMEALLIAQLSPAVAC